MWYNFCWRTDKMSANEIDTILLLQTRSLTDSRWKPILQQNYTQIDEIKTGIKKFSSLWNCNIISSFIKKRIFIKEINCHFEDRCENKRGWSTVHKVTPCGLVTSNGSHFHATARSSHLLASKVVLKKENVFHIYNANQIQVFKPLFFMWKFYLVGKKGFFWTARLTLKSVLNPRTSGIS